MALKTTKHGDVDKPSRDGAFYFNFFEGSFTF